MSERRINTENVEFLAATLAAAIIQRQPEEKVIAPEDAVAIYKAVATALHGTTYTLRNV